MALVPPAVESINCSYPIDDLLWILFWILLKFALSWQKQEFYVAFTATTYPDLTTAGHQITSFCSKSFGYNFDEKKKIHSVPGHSLSGVCVFSTCPRVCFLQGFWFPPSLQRRACGMFTLCQPEWVGVWVWCALWWEGILSKGVPCCTLSYGRGFGHPRPWTGISRLENHPLTCWYSSFIFVCIAHVYCTSVIIRSVLGPSLEVWWCFLGTRNII